MTKITDEPRSTRQYSTTILWIDLFTGLLVLAVFLESVCLGILYLNESLKGGDKNLFLEQHILTKPFASNPTEPGPVPGKHFLENLWAQYLVADALLGWCLGQN